MSDNGAIDQTVDPEIVEAVESRHDEDDRLKPGFVEARFNLGVALAKAKRFPEAIEQFRETLRVDPANAAAKKFLEQAQAIKRRGQ